MPRRMKDPAFQREQMDGRYRPHVEPINRMVDEERTETEWMPYVAPIYGGIDARVLAILRDPGPGTRKKTGPGPGPGRKTGSGMLCIENDDASAERYHNLLTGAEILFEDLIAWNAYPWYINAKPDKAQLERALPVLHKLIGMCPKLEVVMVHGGDAKRAWRMFRKQYPDDAGRLHVIETYHTSRQALWHKDSAVRQEREEKLFGAFSEAAEVLYPDRPVSAKTP